MTILPVILKTGLFFLKTKQTILRCYLKQKKIKKNLGGGMGIKMVI